MPEPLWSFANSINTKRARTMLSHTSFDAVLALVIAARVRAFNWRPFRQEKLRGCYRAEFLMEIKPNTYDAFFNSPVGLRAQYAISEEHGEAANRLILSGLHAKIFRFKRQSIFPTDMEVRWSLSAPQAKIWIDEDEVASQQGESEPQIIYQPWQQRSESGVGLLAPSGNRLIAFGGWLDPTKGIRNNPDKLYRSAEICATDYS